ncbi:MAG: extracellular solute-binding protein [Ilumatobacteraceae bacterium]
MTRTTKAASLLVAASLVIAACGGDDDTSDESTDEPAAEEPAAEGDEPAEEPAAEGDEPTEEPAAEGEDITLWLAGTDTPEAALTYLTETYSANTGGELSIEQIGWGDLIPSLTAALPDSSSTPDVFETGNTQTATFTAVGAYSDLTEYYDELGGDALLQGFVEAGSVGDSVYSLPYYFGSRFAWYRKDLYEAAGVEVPATLADFTTVNATLKEAGSGAYIPGQDWRDGIAWIFANGGDLATYDGGEWTATLSSPESIAGMEMWQELFLTASVAGATDTDATAYQAINDDFLPNTAVATTLAPNWAYWSLGDISENDAGEAVATWNPDTFGAYALPGVDGGVAPVFAGGSNIGISAASEKQESALELMKIIFSDEYQTILAENGLGPANTDFGSVYVDSAADPEIAQISLDTAAAAKLTPAAPGWTSVEEQQLLEQYFQAVAEGGDVASLAAEYDDKINAVING